MASNNITKNHHIFTQDTLKIKGGTTTIKNETSDADTLFNVNDGGSDTGVMRLDGSASSLLFPSGKKIEFHNFRSHLSGTSTDLSLTSASDINLTASLGEVVIDAETDIILDANGGNITLQDEPYSQA